MDGWFCILRNICMYPISHTPKSPDRVRMCHQFSKSISPLSNTYYIDVNELDVCYIILSSLSPSHRLSVVQLRQITVPKWVEQSSRAAKYVLYLVAIQCLLVWICYKVKFNIFTRAFAYVAVSFSLYEWIRSFFLYFYYYYLFLCHCLWITIFLYYQPDGIQ